MCWNGLKQLQEAIIGIYMVVRGTMVTIIVKLIFSTGIVLAIVTIILGLGFVVFSSSDLSFVLCTFTICEYTEI